METYNKSEIMKRAWRILRNDNSGLSWSQCLKRSWAISKEKSNDISPQMMRRIINNLRAFNRSRSATENKPMLAGTQEHFKILNSKKGRKIMKLPVEDESRQMLEQGVLFLHDIIHQRRKESKNFIATTKKQKTTFRNRIINADACVAVNIEDYVNRE